VDQDYAEATKWYRKAADQGQAGAQAKLKRLAMPVVSYERAKHGPKIKDFFIGMSQRQFEDAAEKILQESRMDCQKKESKSADTQELSYYVPFAGSNEYKEHFEFACLQGKFSNSGSLISLMIKPEITKPAFKCEDIKPDEFASQPSHRLCMKQPEP